MKVKRSNPESVSAPHGYTHVVSVESPGRILFVSGQVGRNREGKAEPDFEAQVKQAYENISGILESEGATLEDIVKQNVYTTRPDQVEAFHRVCDPLFKKTPPPASTFIGVTGLARKEFMIEIEVIAVLKE